MSINKKSNFRTYALLGLISLISSCGTEKTSPKTSHSKKVSDVISAVRRPDGNFDITCRDGSKEVKTEAELDSGNVCEKPTPPPVTPPSTTTEDPWNSAYCTESQITESQAFAKIPLPNATEKTYSSKLSFRARERYCYTVDGCTQWGVKPTSKLPTPSSSNDQTAYDRVLFADKIFFGAAYYFRSIVSLIGEKSATIKFILYQNRPLTEIGFISREMYALGNLTDFYFNIGFIDFSKSNTVEFIEPLFAKKPIVDRYYSQNSPISSFDEKFYKPNWSGVFGNSCYRYTASNRIPITVGQGNTAILEQEVVMFGRY